MNAHDSGLVAAYRLAGDGGGRAVGWNEAQDELNSRLSEQMNKTMYVLSIVAGIFLPLGLLTGLLGINVGGMPGVDSNWTFLFGCIFLVVTATIPMLFFRRKGWL